jgi:hypothetical protein
MEINNLLESANSYKSLQADASRLAEKWSASGLLEGLDERKSSNMAMILENQAKQIVAEQSSTGTGGTFSAGDGEQWAGVALPLVRKVFAQIVAQDFVSVQPMNLPSGLVFYLDFKYGSAQPGFANNSNMYGNVSTGNDKMSVDEEVSGGLYGAGRFGYSINEASASITSQATGSAPGLADVGYDSSLTLADLVIIDVPTSSLASTFDVEAIRGFRLSSGSADLTDYPEYTALSGGNIRFIATAASITNDVDGAVVKYSLQPADNARGDFEDQPSGSIEIPEVNVELKSEAVVAKTRKLKAQWTPEFAQDLNAYHSVDAEAELTSLLSEYISMEIDLEILDMLIKGAVTTERWSAVNNKEWNGSAWNVNSAGFYNTQGQWFQTLGTKIQKLSNIIHQKTLRGGANFLVCSPTVATILESIPGFAADSDGDAAKASYAFGVQKVGQLNGRYKVYKNPYMTTNVILLGFRGGQFLESGAVFAPYIPLIMTPLVYDPDTFVPRKGLLTRYAKKIVRPEFYGKIEINGLNTL